MNLLNFHRNDERESCTEAEKDSLNAKIKVVQDEANALSKVVRDLQSLFKDKVNATVPQTNIRPTIAVNRIPIVDSGYFDNNEDNVSEGSFNNDEENKSKAGKILFAVYVLLSSVSPIYLDVFGIGVSTITQADINKSAINDLNQQPTINQIELPPKVTLAILHLEKIYNYCEESTRDDEFAQQLTR